MNDEMRLHDFHNPACVGECKCPGIIQGTCYVCERPDAKAGEECPGPRLPLARRLAYAVIALGAFERQVGKPLHVILPGMRAEMLGELIIEAGEQMIGLEAAAKYDSTLDTPRERFLDSVRAASRELQASAPQKPRLVRPDGGPLSSKTKAPLIVR